MPRPQRLIVPGVALHIIQRGNNRIACFKDDRDHLMYLAHLRQLAERYDCAVHAYCLMTNHVHLLVTPQTDDACTGLMRDLGQRYVQYFNRRHQRSGTLWEGRFRSCLVESAMYVLACYRYIELNPVRAGMVDHASGYLWSSYAVNGGMRSDPLVSYHAEFLALGGTAGVRHAAYRGLLEQPLEPGLQRAIREASSGGYPIASQTFKDSVLGPLGFRTEPGKSGRPAKSPEALYVLE